MGPVYLCIYNGQSVLIASKCPHIVYMRELQPLQLPISYDKCMASIFASRIIKIIFSRKLMLLVFLFIEKSLQMVMFVAGSHCC